MASEIGMAACRGRRIPPRGGARAASGPPGKVVRRDLPQARSVEGRAVAAEGEAAVEPGQPPHRRAVGGDVGAGDLVHEFVVIDRVAREKQAVRLVEQGDRSR